MSIGSPLEIRTQLSSALGKAGLPYWKKLRDFLVGKLGRVEFEELIRQWINTPELGEGLAVLPCFYCIDMVLLQFYYITHSSMLSYTKRLSLHKPKTATSPHLVLLERNESYCRIRTRLRSLTDGYLAWARVNELEYGLLPDGKVAPRPTEVWTARWGQSSL